MEQCPSICRHYKGLKFHLDTIKPRSIEYLQKRHKSKAGHGCGRGRFRLKSPKSSTNDRGRGTLVKSSIFNGCGFCGADPKHARRTDCPAWKFNCYNCDIKGHFGQVCRYKKNPQQCQHCPKAVQEVQTNDLDQNAGN